MLNADFLLYNVLLSSPMLRLSNKTFNVNAVDVADKRMKLTEFFSSTEKFNCNEET